jgi:hypothetical protein
MATALLDRQPLDPGQLHGIDAWWGAANYLSVGQIYLRADPLRSGDAGVVDQYVQPSKRGHGSVDCGFHLGFHCDVGTEVARQPGVPGWIMPLLGAVGRVTMPMFQGTGAPSASARALWLATVTTALLLTLGAK